MYSPSRCTICLKKTGPSPRRFKWATFEDKIEHITRYHSIPDTSPYMDPPHEFEENECGDCYWNEDTPRRTIISSVTNYIGKKLRRDGLEIDIGKSESEAANPSRSIRGGRHNHIVYGLTSGTMGSSMVFDRWSKGGILEEMGEEILSPDNRPDKLEYLDWYKSAVLEEDS